MKNTPVGGRSSEAQTHPIDIIIMVFAKLLNIEISDDGVENWCGLAGPNALPTNSLDLSPPNFLFGVISGTVCTLNSQDPLQICIQTNHTTNLVRYRHIWFPAITCPVNTKEAMLRHSLFPYT
jgi:hypothetical protein